MPTDVDRPALLRLLEANAQLVEVLPEEEYQLEHLPGAINLPLKQLNRHTAGRLRHDQPIVVYCNDPR